MKTRTRIDFAGRLPGDFTTCPMDAVDRSNYARWIARGDRLVEVEKHFAAVRLLCLQQDVVRGGRPIFCVPAALRVVFA